ncbi:cupin domain-containing protein [Halorubellus salinus]|uniref:cupin domain-containing protein n=1 Tax=Halorubellus salinus TaxID=755309 RepID=UPI001D064874|nr:cupin domain-containing protein [Halorubellus salinus]
MEPVDESDLEWREYEHGESTFRRKQLAAAAGASDDLGCSLYELPPGKRSWPYHYHAGNAEALYVLAGEGLVRLDDDEYRVDAGSYVPCPASPEGAHRVVNDGDEPLRYLAVSTMQDPDVIEYPDSEKVGVFAGSPPGSREERTVHGYFRTADAVDYWDGEN